MSLGDLYNKNQEAYNQYWEIMTGQHDIYPVGNLAPEPETPLPNPESVPALTDTKAVVDLINTYNAQYFAKLSEMFTALKEGLSKQIWMTKNPNWVEPPIIANQIDAFNAGSVKIAPSGELELIKIIIPKGYVAVIDRFGNEADSGDEAWDDVEWTFKIDQKFLDSSVEWYNYDTTVPTPANVKGKQYTGFHIQLGQIFDPCKFSMPFILTERQIFSVYVKNLSSTVTYYANARVMGFLWQPRLRTSGGYPIEYHLP